MTYERDYCAARFPEELAKRLNGRMEVIVLPTIPVSYSRGWEEFPETLWVTRATLKAYIADLCTNLASNGVRKIFFINGHGANVSVIEEIGREFMSQGIRCAQIDLELLSGLDVQLEDAHTSVCATT